MGITGSMGLPRRIPFLDLRIQCQEKRKVLLEAIDQVFQHGRLVMGPEVEQLESTVASLCGRKYAVGVNSGTDALYLALRCLGIESGDEVLVPALSWIATANAVALTGARPVFCDIRDDLNIDPEGLESHIDLRTKALLVVHFTGKVCEMREILNISKKYNLWVIEDAAQAFGARKFGVCAGSFGDLGCFSMNPMKVFAACGEAGMITVDQTELYEKLLALRYNGTLNRETCISPSLNSRLDTIQAAILLKRLDRLKDIVQRRRANARFYDEQLGDIVEVPIEAEDAEDVFYTYTIKADRRDALKAYLEDKGIETKIQHPILMPRQPAYVNGVKGAFRNAEKLLERILCIPVHEKLEPADLDYVAHCIRSFYEGTGRCR